MNRLIETLVGIAWLWLGMSALGVETVANLVVAQRPGTKLVDITYDLSSTAWPGAKVSLVVSNAGVAVAAASLSGDVGNTPSGTHKTVLWNMGADWNGNLAVLSFTVRAEPPQGLDTNASSWDIVNSRWVRNHYANGSVTMGDNDTGLMWIYNAGTSGLMNWDAAVSYCQNMVYGGYSDWFLPDIDQLGSAHSQNSVFSNVYSDRYWSSSIHYSSGQKGAWCKYGLGSYDSYSFVTDLNRAWPCRLGK